MIRTLLLVFTLVVALQAINIDERYVQRTAKDVGIEEEDVRTCASNANITENDIRHLELFMQQRSQTTDLEDRVTRMGCFYACMMQKAGLMSNAHWNADKVKEVIISRSNTQNNPNYIPILQIVDNCADQVKNETEKCAAAVKFMLCLRQR